MNIGRILWALKTPIAIGVGALYLKRHDIYDSLTGVVKKSKMSLHVDDLVASYNYKIESKKYDEATKTYKVLLYKIGEDQKIDEEPTEGEVKYIDGVLKLLIEPKK